MSIKQSIQNTIDRSLIRNEKYFPKKLLYVVFAVVQFSKFCLI